MKFYFLCDQCGKIPKWWRRRVQDGHVFCSTRCRNKYNEAVEAGTKTELELEEEAEAAAEAELEREEEAMHAADAELQREKDARVEQARSVAREIRLLYEQIDSGPANGKAYYDCSNRIIELHQWLTSGHVELGDIYGSVITESSKICLEILTGWDKNPPFVRLEADLYYFLEHLAPASVAQQVGYVVESVRTELLLRAVSLRLPPRERACAYSNLALIKQCGRRGYLGKPEPEEVYYLEEAAAAFREHIKLEHEDWSEMDGFAYVLERLGRAREAARVRGKCEEVRIRAELESKEASRRLDKEFGNLAMPSALTYAFEPEEALSMDEPDEQIYEDAFDLEPDSEDCQPGLEATPLDASIGFNGKCSQLLAILDLVVQRATTSGDEDVDIVAASTQPLLGGKFIVHCRDRTRPIGQPPLRDLHRVVVAEHGVKGILIASHSFTEAARRFAQGKNLELIDGNQLELLTATSPPDSR